MTDLENAISPDVLSAERGGVRRMEVVNLLLVLAGTGIFFFFREGREVWSFLAGGLLNVVNLRLLTLIVRGLTGQRKISKGKLVAQVVIKFGGVLGVLAFLMLVVRPAPLPFLLGLSTVVAAVVLEGVFGIFRREG
jgi:hypothetical protein